MVRHSTVTRIGTETQYRCTATIEWTGPVGRTIVRIADLGFASLNISSGIHAFVSPPTSIHFKVEGALFQRNDMSVLLTKNACSPQTPKRSHTDVTADSPSPDETYYVAMKGSFIRYPYHHPPPTVLSPISTAMECLASERRRKRLQPPRRRRPLQHRSLQAKIKSQLMIL